MAKTRLNLEISADLTNFIDTLAIREDTTRVEIFRRAISIMKAYDIAYKKGIKHIGFVSDSSKLDTEIVGILNVEPV
jgi:hypothetical protein